jgi:hypothetical protein
LLIKFKIRKRRDFAGVCVGSYGTPSDSQEKEEGGGG